jgi:hypothetical protein
MCSKGAAGSPGSSSGMQEQLLVSSFGSHDSVCKPDLPPGEHMRPRLKSLIFLISKVKDLPLLFRVFLALIRIISYTAAKCSCLHTLNTTKLKSENTLYSTCNFEYDP